MRRLLLAVVLGCGLAASGAASAQNISVIGAAGGGPPTGACGGDLGGTFPNCTVTGGTHLTGTLSSGLTYPSATLTGPAIVNSNVSGIPASIVTTSALTIQAADGTAGRFNMSTAGGNPAIIQYRADGTIASPTAVGLNDILGSVNWAGWSGTAYPIGASIVASARETFSGTASGTAVAINATAAATTGAVQEAIFWNGIAAGAGATGGIGTMNAPNGYFAGNGVPGVTCAANSVTLLTLVVTKGIVTHC